MRQISTPPILLNRQHQKTAAIYPDCQDDLHHKIDFVNLNVLFERKKLGILVDQSSIDKQTWPFEMLRFSWSFLRWIFELYTSIFLKELSNLMWPNDKENQREVHVSNSIQYHYGEANNYQGCYSCSDDDTDPGNGVVLDQIA